MAENTARAQVSLDALSHVLVYTHLRAKILFADILRILVAIADDVARGVHVELLYRS